MVSKDCVNCIFVRWSINGDSLLLFIGVLAHFAKQRMWSRKKNYFVDERLIVVLINWKKQNLKS